jgi:hypothetical protein
VASGPREVCGCTWQTSSLKELVTFQFGFQIRLSEKSQAFIAVGHLLFHATFAHAHCVMGLVAFSMAQLDI